ncbi:MAG: cupin domain-containing protein [Dermatophilaceae bacterium]
MTDGLLVSPGRGRELGGMTLKAGAENSTVWSAFEAEVAPGFDVGAHRHERAEEVFYILSGELDLLAFHPDADPVGDWRLWTSANGSRVLRGGPGSFMYVPAGCPHAFYNPHQQPARMLFVVSPSGHEHYLQELTELLSRPGPPDPEQIAVLRARHDIHQLTPLTTR